jgi:hypothetical protein
MHGLRLASRGLILAVSAALLAACTPFHVLDAHTTSAPGPKPFDLATLGPESLASRAVTPPDLQGFSAPLSHVDEIAQKLWLRMITDERKWRLS